MLDPDLVSGWKREYGKIYSVSDGRNEYVFRALTFAEHDEVLDSEYESSADAEEHFVRTALLWPTELSDRVSAGVVTTLAEEILEVSGFLSPAHMKRMLEVHRKARGIHQMMKAFVLATMPAYKEEDLNVLTFDQLAAKVALAEQIIEINQKSVGIESEMTLEIVDPVEEAEKAKREAALHAASKKPGTAGLTDPIAQKLQAALGSM